jgi:hypothetical protein
MTMTRTRLAQVFLVCFCLAAVVPLSRLVTDARARSHATPAKATMAPVPVKHPAVRPTAKPRPVNV